MFASIRRYQAKPNAMTEIGLKVQKGLLPILQAQPGFVSYHAIDAGRDVAISVSFYADRIAADAANHAAAEWVQRNLSGLLSAPEVTVGEVVASSTLPA